MSNLIITIISIALVAVAAIMGIFYGGQAFNSGQAKAQASTIISAAQQIASAWQIYAAEHGGNFTLTDPNWRDGTAADLVPKYLSSLPYFSYVVDNEYPAYSHLFYVTKYANDNIVHEQNDSNFLILGALKKDVCEQVNMAAVGDKTIPAISVTTSVAKAMYRPFRCAYSLDGAGGTEKYFFGYWVY